MKVRLGMCCEFKHNIEFDGCALSPLVPIPRVDERRAGAEHLQDSVPSTLDFSEALKTRPTNRDDTFDGGCNGGP